MACLDYFRAGLELAFSSVLNHVPRMSEGRCLAGVREGLAGSYNGVFAAWLIGRALREPKRGLRLYAVLKAAPAVEDVANVAEAFWRDLEAAPRVGAAVYYLLDMYNEAAALGGRAAELALAELGVERGDPLAAAKFSCRDLKTRGDPLVKLMFWTDEENVKKAFLEECAALRASDLREAAERFRNAALFTSGSWISKYYLAKYFFLDIATRPHTEREVMEGIVALAKAAYAVRRARRVFDAFAHSTPDTAAWRVLTA
ncbi:MAG: hypothetical protein QXH44_10055 [Pyrobaculum sp.]|jgi:hypothetical protein